jgi:hypothetical protein
MVFFLKDVTRTPCASAGEGRVGKDLVTLLRLDAHAAARRYDMPCSPEPAPGACVIAVRHRASAAPASDKSHCIHGHPGCHVASAVLVRWGIKHNLRANESLLILNLNVSNRWDILLEFIIIMIILTIFTSAHNVHLMGFIFKIFNTSH